MAMGGGGNPKAESRSPRKKAEVRIGSRVCSHRSGGGFEGLSLHYSLIDFPDDE